MVGYGILWSSQTIATFSYRRIFPGYRFSFFHDHFHHTMLNAAALSITHNTPRQDTSSRS